RISSPSAAASSTRTSTSTAFSAMASPAARRSANASVVSPAPSQMRAKTAPSRVAGAMNAMLPAGARTSALGRSTVAGADSRMRSWMPTPDTAV
ncbi:MAG: hypothetical protein ACK4YP_27215, partial [Myxococcota bacterium]